MPPTRGIEGHVRLLGILWVAYGALHAIPGLLVAGGTNILSPEVPSFVINLIGAIGWMLLIGGAAGVLVGAGLLMRQPWAHMASLILSAISLINIPFGTALGIYNMWALLPAAHEAEYRALSRVA